MIHAMIQLLAAATGGEMNIVSTAAITAVCSAITGALLYGQGRKARTVTIDGKPSVRIEDEFVRRSELAEFKGEIRNEVLRMERSVDKIGDIMLTRDEAMRRTLKETAETLSEKIEQVASGAYEARRRIHETLNTQRERLAQMEVRGDIAKHIGSLGKALMGRPCVADKKPASNPPS